MPQIKLRHSVAMGLSMLGFNTIPERTHRADVFMCFIHFEPFSRVFFDRLSIFLISVTTNSARSSVYNETKNVDDPITLFMYIGPTSLLLI